MIFPGTNLELLQGAKHWGSMRFPTIWELVLRIWRGIPLSAISPQSIPKGQIQKYSEYPGTIATPWVLPFDGTKRWLPSQNSGWDLQPQTTSDNFQQSNLYPDEKTRADQCKGAIHTDVSLLMFVSFLLSKTKTMIPLFYIRSLADLADIPYLRCK